MLIRFPDPAQEAGRSIKTIVDATRRQTGRSYLEQGMNGATAMVTSGIGQLIEFPLRALAIPSMRTVNDLAISAVKGAVGLTWQAIRQIPIFPVMAGTSSAQRPGDVASRRDAPAPLSGTGNLGLRQGPDAPRANAEPGSAGRAA